MSIPNRLRLVSLIFFGGGLVAFFYVIRISGWEPADGGARFIVPDGGGAFVKAEILPLLSRYGGIAIGLGIALLVAAQVYAMRQRRAAREGRTFPEPVRMGPLRTLALVAFAVLMGLVITFGYRWYDYVINAASPYDEVGIAINSRLPESARDWGCGRLKERFARSIPPLGCSDASGRSWR